MKKVIMFLGMILISYTSLNAQTVNENNSKPQKVFGPQKGDIALGINAQPILNYAGNLFNSSTSSPTFSFFDNNAFYIKYFLNNKTALRCKLRLGYSTSELNNSVINDTLAYTYLNDKLKSSSANIILGLGFEKRRGKNRLYALYGGGIQFSYSKTTSEYTYGNAFSPTNRNPTSTNSFNSGSSSQMSARQLKTNPSPTTGIGLFGLAGLEFFICPNISIGGEFNLLMNLTFTGDRTSEIEMWNSALNSTVINKQNSSGGYSFKVDNDNLNGAFNFMFYF